MIYRVRIGDITRHLRRTLPEISRREAKAGAAIYVGLLNMVGSGWDAERYLAAAVASNRHPVIRRLNKLVIAR